MRFGFNRVVVPFLFAAAFVGLSYRLSAQQAGMALPAASPAAVEVPDAPTPQVELASLVTDPQSPQTNPATLPNAPGTSASPICIISGTVTDVQDEIVPGAVVTLDGVTPADHRQTVANDDGGFEFQGLKPGVTYRLTIKAQGFVDWKSPAIVLTPGQFDILTGVKMQLQGGQTSVTVYASREQLATEQLHIEEQQRVLGFIPNFYVVYDSANAVPLTSKMKFKLAWKVSTDPITAVGIFFMAGVNQGARTPDYQLGAVGYGERVGAVAADGFSDIMIGGAILPSLLHQDPRYYYQGTGTTRSRLLHAFSYPFICKGDNGHWQPNYSTIGGDVASSALENLYYPRVDRTGSWVAQEVAISTLQRTASSLIQEFVLRKFTSGPKTKN